MGNSFSEPTTTPTLPKHNQPNFDTGNSGVTYSNIGNVKYCDLKTGNNDASVELKTSCKTVTKPSWFFGIQTTTTECNRYIDCNGTKMNGLTWPAVQNKSKGKWLQHREKSGYFDQRYRKSFGNNTYVQCTGATTTSSSNKRYVKDFKDQPKLQYNIDRHGGIITYKCVNA